MNAFKNILLNGKHGKPILTDIFYNATDDKKPVVIYAHGFNGFKDWGNFDIIAKQFADSGLVFVKFNFSHNGTTPEHPEDFTDLEAYGNNNYTKELDDLGSVIDWVCDSDNEHTSAIDRGRIFLVGHSRGGGIVILKAALDERVKAIATWASVAECKTPWGSWGEEKMKEWKESGVAYATNSRTKQEMPLYYQLYENYQQHTGMLNIKDAITSLSIPVLICHGESDPAVAVNQAKKLHEWQPASELFLVDSDHVFGRKHPWTDEVLPIPMQDVVNKTVQFFKAAL